MASIKIGNNTIGKVSVIEPYEDPNSTETDMWDIKESDWTRPSGWLDMPTDDNMVAALIFVPSGAHDFTVSVYARGTGVNTNNMPTYILLDWGDNTSGVIYGTRNDNGSYSGYTAYRHKMYDYDLLSPSTEIEVGGTTARQALIKLDASVSGIGYFSARVLGGNEFGHQTTYEGERKYDYYDPSGVIRTAPTRDANRNNNHTSTLLDLYASGASITGCRISDNESYGDHRYLERAYLNIGNLGSTDDTFVNCTSLESVYIPYSATTGKTNFNYMFHNCHMLKSIPNLDTSSATSMRGMFGSCKSITTLPAFDTSNVTDFNGFFTRCYNIKKIPNFDFSSALDVSNLFSHNFQLKSIPSGFNAPSATGWSHTFYRCENLVAVPKLDLSSATSIHGLFRECRKLKNKQVIDAPNLPASNDRCTYIFEACTSLEEVHIKSIGSSRHWDRMFNGCHMLRKLTWDDPTDVQPTSISTAFGSCYKIRKMPAFDLSECTRASTAFSQCRVIREYPTFDLSKIENSSYMFHYNLHLKEANFVNARVNATGSNWNTDNMFSYCENLKSVSGIFENQETTPHYFRSMFGQCYSLFDVSNFVISGSTSSSTNNSNLFSSSRYLKKLPKDINTQYGCKGMFNDQYNLISVPAYDLSASTNNTSMFNNCRSLRECNASGINASIGFNNCYLSSGAIYNIFNNLNTVSSATIDIRYNYGRVELHSDTTAIATNKGWTVLT